MIGGEINPRTTDQDRYSNIFAARVKGRVRVTKELCAPVLALTIIAQHVERGKGLLVKEKHLPSVRMRGTLRYSFYDVYRA